MYENQTNNQISTLKNIIKTTYIEVNKWLFFLLFVGYLFLIINILNIGLSYSARGAGASLGVGLTIFVTILFSIFLVLIGFIGIMVMKLRGQRVVNLDLKKLLIFICLQIYVFILLFGVKNISYDSNILFYLPFIIMFLFFFIIFFETFSTIKISHMITKLLSISVSIVAVIYLTVM